MRFWVKYDHGEPVACTTHAGGQHRHLEVLGAYAQQLLEMMQKSDVESIREFGPVILFEQKTASRSPCSTGAIVRRSSALANSDRASYAVPADYSRRRLAESAVGLERPDRETAKPRISGAWESASR